MSNVEPSEKNPLPTTQGLQDGAIVFAPFVFSPIGFPSRRIASADSRHPSTPFPGVGYAPQSHERKGPNRPSGAVDLHRVLRAPAERIRHGDGCADPKLPGMMVRTIVLRANRCASGCAAR